MRFSKLTFFFNLEAGEVIKGWFTETKQESTESLSLPETQSWSKTSQVIDGIPQEPLLAHRMLSLA